MADKKSDLERLGVFREDGYHTINDPYTRPSKFNFNAAAGKGKQMIVGTSKSTSALNEGYFSQFQRCFEGEAYMDPLTRRRLLNKADKDKLKGKVFRLPSIPKKSEGSGDYYGTFSGPITSMSADFNSGKEKFKGPIKRNFFTNPPKKGTGYGYLDVTFHKFPKYLSEPFDSKFSIKEIDRTKPIFKTGGLGEFFQANPFTGKFDTGYEDKSQVSVKMEAVKPFLFKPGHLSDPFNPWSNHQAEPYNEKLKRPLPYLKNVTNNTGKLYTAIPGSKSVRQPSILDVNINNSINNLNYGTINTVFSL